MKMIEMKIKKYTSNFVQICLCKKKRICIKLNIIAKTIVKYGVKGMILNIYRKYHIKNQLEKM